MNSKKYIFRTDVITEVDNQGKVISQYANHSKLASDDQRNNRKSKDESKEYDLFIQRNQHSSSGMSKRNLIEEMKYWGILDIDGVISQLNNSSVITDSVVMGDAYFMQMIECRNNEEDQTVVLVLDKYLDQLKIILKQICVLFKIYLDTRWSFGIRNDPNTNERHQFVKRNVSSIKKLLSNEKYQK